MLVDLYDEVAFPKVATRPREQRVDLCPRRVAATIAALGAKGGLPFERQPVPFAAATWGAPTTSTAPGRRRKGLWFSDPPKGTHKPLLENEAEAATWFAEARRSSRRRLDV